MEQQQNSVADRVVTFAHGHKQFEILLSSAIHSLQLSISDLILLVERFPNAQALWDEFTNWQVKRCSNDLVSLQTVFEEYLTEILAVERTLHPEPLPKRTFDDVWALLRKIRALLSEH